jgi:hypothetical protein
MAGLFLIRSRIDGQEPQALADAAPEPAEKAA